MRLSPACRWPLAVALLSLAGCAGGPPANDGAWSAPDSVADAYARPSAALMWPGTTRAYQVLPSGDLYNGEWRVRFALGSGADTAARPRTIAYEDRWLPVTRWVRRASGLRWEFEALSFPEPAPRDTGLMVSLRLRVVNERATPRTAQARVTLEPPGPDPEWVAFDAPETPSPPLAFSGADTAYAWAAQAGSGAALEREWTLEPGATAEWRLLLPTYPTPAGRLAALARPTHARRREEVRLYWNTRLDEATHFALGDPEVERALRAARLLLLSCWEPRGALRVPIGGPFHYRDVWLRDGARLVQALAVSGHTDDARQLAAGLLAFQWPQGAFLSQRGQSDGTGQALWAFDQALLRPMHADSVGRFASAAQQAWKWFEWQRDFGRQSGWRLGTLMPYADPRDAELVRAQLVGTDAWALAGYRSTARLLRAAGRGPEADEVERTRAVYLNDFERALSQSRSRDIPPSWQEVGRDWGNLAVGWPCRVLPHRHPRLLALARRVWAEAGGAGLVTYGHRDSLHYYLGADLGTWALLDGRRAQADSVLEALLHWRSASGAAGEIFSRGGDYGRNLLPHPTSAAALVALVRNALIYDDDDTLQVTLGARAAWWRGARIERAPTRWGLIDLAFERSGAAAHWGWTAVPVWTTLTLPPGTRLDQPPPAPLTALSESVVLAPPGTREARVAVRDIGP